MREIAFRFNCESASLLGVVHLPPEPAELGVLMFVGGGPQYRAGGHRQLVLWARALAAQGIPVMRFDYRGVGDSGAAFEGFDAMEADTAAGIREFFERVPGVSKLVLWGECDASSAILMHAHKDPRVVGISLQNPWARTTAGQARAYIKHYYLHRLTERSFWKKVLQVKFNPFSAGLSLLQNAYRGWRQPVAASGSSPAAQSGSYIERMKKGCKAYQGKVLLYMSGRDLIAREFDELITADAEWRSLMSRDSVRRIDLPLADHTFSSAAMRNTVLDSASEWLREIRSSVTQR
jgi:exosortase A-associated hydrolase 1